jgi:hypothetical protein
LPNGDSVRDTHALSLVRDGEASTPIAHIATQRKRERERERERERHWQRRPTHTCTHISGLRWHRRTADPWMVHEGQQRQLEKRHDHNVRAETPPSHRQCHLARPPPPPPCTPPTHRPRASERTHRWAAGCGATMAPRPVCSGDGVCVCACMSLCAHVCACVS